MSKAGITLKSHARFRRRALQRTALADEVTAAIWNKFWFGTASSVPELIGLRVTLRQGTLSATAASGVVLGGNRVNISLGTLSPQVSAARTLSGLRIQTTLGALTPVASSSLSVTLSGNRITLGQGAVSPVASSSGTVAISGSRITLGLGVLTGTGNQPPAPTGSGGGGAGGGGRWDHVGSSYNKKRAKERRDLLATVDDVAKAVFGDTTAPEKTPSLSQELVEIPIKHAKIEVPTLQQVDQSALAAIIIDIEDDEDVAVEMLLLS